MYFAVALWRIPPRFFYGAFHVREKFSRFFSHIAVLRFCFFARLHANVSPSSGIFRWPDGEERSAEAFWEIRVHGAHRSWHCFGGGGLNCQRFASSFVICGALYGGLRLIVCFVCVCVFLCTWHKYFSAVRWQLTRRCQFSDRTIIDVKIDRWVVSNYSFTLFLTCGTCDP